MHSLLYYQPLDDSLFPELERAPGVYGIEMAFTNPRIEPRIPAPKDSPVVLLVSYTLLAKSVPSASTWQLDIVGVGSDGKPKSLTLPMMEPAPKGDNMQTIPPDPDLVLHPGTVFRQVFWVDLGPLWRDQTLLRGDRLTLRYGTAAASLVIPGAAKP